MNLPIPVKPTLAARRWPILFLLFLTTSAWAKDMRMENNPWQFWGYYEQMHSTASESVASVSIQIPLTS
jgi:hypothetical protein